MLAYSAAELCSFNRDCRALKPSRLTRKRLFSLHLWAPSCVRSRLSIQGIGVVFTPSAPVLNLHPAILPAAAAPLHSVRASVVSQLSFGAWNVRSLGNTFTSVAEAITDRQLDILAVTETWHGDSDDVALRRSAPAGYRIVDVPRPPTIGPPLRPGQSSHGGGVALIFRDHLVAKKIDVIAGHKSFEFACVSISTPRGPVAAVVIYRRPGPLSTVFLEEFSSLLETLATFNSKLIIAGDLNVHLDDQNCSDTIRLTQLLASFALTQHVDQPTHDKGHILDVIITRSDSPVADLTVDPPIPTLSDHGLITCSLSADRPPSPVFVSRLVRSWKKLDRNAFRSALQSSPLGQANEFFSGKSVEELFTLYNVSLRELVEKLVPQRRLTVCHRLTSPWFDGDCRAIKRRVRLLERRYRCSRDPSDRLAWISALRHKHQAFVEKENNYWEGVVTANSNNPQKLWRSVATLLGDTLGPASGPIPPFTAEEFQRFLEEKVDSVRSATAGALPPQFTHTDSLFSSFTSCSEETISRLISGSPAKTCDLDPVPTFIIKEFSDVLVPFLTRLCNASITEGYFPLSQKEAIVIPALKKRGLDPAEMKNYRPISNLCFTSKLVEKAVCLQLSDYLTVNDLWPRLQSGFRRFHSTESAVLKVLSDIYAAIDEGHVALLALLDVSAAFDTVDHQILLQRLSTSYGISGSAYDWFCSYLVDREQTVRLGTTRSLSSPVRCGVPQGSILGPLLYVLYTADVIPLVELLGSHVHLYADDTQLYEAGCASESEVLCRRIIATVSAVSLWMASNRLRLNQDKTQFLWLGTRQQLAKRDTQQLAAISPSLVESPSARDLGVILDSELTFQPHVAKLCQTCFFHLRRIRAIRRSLSSKALLSVVHSFICNRIDFCNSALYGSSAFVLERLQSILNAAARLILKIPKYGHVSDAIRNTLHWLPVQRRIDFKLCLIVRNCLAGAAPAYLRVCCVPVSSDPNRRHLRSAARGDLVTRRFRTSTYGRCAFAVAAPALWNSLPLNIRLLADSLGPFKRELKTFLFAQHQQRH